MSSTVESMGENARPNTNSFASPSKKSLKVTATPAPAVISKEEECIAQEVCESSTQEEEEEEEEEDEAMQDLRNKFREALRLLREQKEETNRFKVMLDAQKDFLSNMERRHTKELALKDNEIADLKKKNIMTKDESDRFRVESQRKAVKAESTYKAEIEQLKAELRSANTTGNNANAGRSFSMKSFSTMFQSGKSQKLQQKVQASVAERDHARLVKSMSDELDKTKTQLKRLQAESEEYLDCSAQSAMQIKELTERCDFLESKLRDGKAKFKKMQIAVQEKKQQLTEITLKAGWVAEQLTQATEDLNYERSKHIKHSRLQQVKQMEELQRVKQELEELKKAKAAPAAAAGPVNSASASSSKKTEVAVKPATTAAAPAPAAAVEEVVLLGTETIAELVALKAKQREQRDVKTDQVLKKQREKAKLEQQQVQEGDAIGQMLHRLRGCGGEDSDFDDQSDQEWI